MCDALWSEILFRYLVTTEFRAFPEDAYMLRTNEIKLICLFLHRNSCFNLS